ncbi:hypothetical protein IG611_05345 [Pectobacterium sp. A535-S3-A17]|uniref:hypothetical protein n=1 Tax=Pectobacterium quasiaquaticum TaxID=2774015 RepID=UPI0018773014|nr:hypothetical protein [Pectobacterium quasiaquaticum]MBE5214760.1 hypothetical protein [Pectobacterium quasiaquaticum]MBE5224799.1 hypothetical protein [Pectobacterium quasiaquaticum]
MRTFKLADLQVLSEKPTRDDIGWLIRAEDSISYLKANAQNDEIVIYASGSSILIHGALALAKNVTPPNWVSMRNMHLMMDSCWKIQKSWGGGRGHRMYLEPPLGDSGLFKGGEALLFRRSFNGIAEDRAPLELSQKLVHSLELHYLSERNAYCRLDTRGDIEDVIKIIQHKVPPPFESLEVVTIQRKDLDTYMALSKTALVLKFDFTRVRWGNFAGWGNINRYNKDEVEISYHGGVNGEASYCNGAMIVRPQVTIRSLIKVWKDEENPSKRKYVAFKIFDRKNNCNVETSCNPDFTSNYFQQSTLPWEVSPAFFRPEVLHRFKADPEKYTFEERSITCRNAWHLKSYDINEAGLVHAYIGDLAHLPYEEQLYWQSFNEWPKGTISARAFQTDIVGEWDLSYEPLSTLKHTISLMDKNPPSWWKSRGTILSNSVQYPATDSVKEWGDEVLALDQYLVEGFLQKPLSEIAKCGGRSIEPKWASLRVLQEALITKGVTEDHAKTLVQPMQKLHALRTEVRGHASTEKKKKAISEARTDHGNLRTHFTHIVAECERSLAKILIIFDIKLDG